MRITQPEWIMGRTWPALLTKKTDDEVSRVIDVIQDYFRDVGYPIMFNVYNTANVGFHSLESV